MIGELCLENYSKCKIKAQIRNKGYEVEQQTAPIYPKCPCSLPLLTF